MNGIGQRIRLARKLAGLSQNELAEKCNFAIQTVSKWELDKVDLPISTLKKISEALNVSIAFLVDIEGTNGSTPDLLHEENTGYNLQSDTRINFMEMEIKHLVECKEKLMKQIEVQSKLINAYEAGYVPSNVPKMGK